MTALLDTAALVSDGAGIDETVLNDIIDLTYTASNLAAYRVQIAAQARVSDVASLQTIVNAVDASETLLIRFKLRQRPAMPPVLMPLF